MKTSHTFTVIPALPPPLARLGELAHNLRWSWNHDTIELFRRLDADLWEASAHNPVLLLCTVDQARLDEAASDDGFLTHLDRVCADFDAYMAPEHTWFRRITAQGAGPSAPPPNGQSGALVAYFSAEFGLTDCLSIFAGGLGLLAGDHLKSSSDLDVPLIGVGLLYQQGYFRQYLNEAGWQQEVHESNDFHALPLEEVEGPGGAPLTVQIAFPGAIGTAHVWRVRVGRLPLYLLDTNVPENQPAERDITDQLYGGDSELRLRQEMVLGIGGYRLLAALGLEPAVYHMNEGHSAFLGLERIRSLIERHGVSFWEAREAASAGLIFTTHTPVAAGHDYFSPELMERYFGAYAQSLGLSWGEFLGLGRVHPDDGSEPFCMTTLALRLAARSNAVSQLHGRVTRQMWQALWPGVMEQEVPVGHVTNGVHLQSWISREMNQLYERYLGTDWQSEPADSAAWQRVARIPADELWNVHRRRRVRLVEFARTRLRAQLQSRGASRVECDLADEVLDADALTIGVARRFATYKRATLLLRDLDRLANIVNDPQRPVQVLFAGKAHPQDQAGKELIRRIVEVARQDRFRRRIVFLENYDTAMARYLVQGADVWLNTPRRFLEASGTSGMKAAANGGLNLSILDGWWDEAWPLVDALPISAGWAIGRRETYADPDYQDQVEAAALYHLLEHEVVPLFYDGGPSDAPRRWTAAMKASIAALCPYFNTHRMVEEYVQRFYLPEAAAFCVLAQDGLAEARDAAAWRARVREHWPQVRVTLQPNTPATCPAGTALCLRSYVNLGGLCPDDVAVELFEGRVDATGELLDPQSVRLSASSDSDGDGSVVYEGSVVPQRRSGTHGLTVRVRPQQGTSATAIMPGLVTWAA